MEAAFSSKMQLSNAAFPTLQISRARLQRITFCFQVLKLPLLSYKTFSFCNAQAIRSPHCSDLVSVKVFPFARRQFFSM